MDEKPPKPRSRRRPSAAQTIGGVLFGFEQQVWRTAPPPQELVHHARPDSPVPAGDGTLLTFVLPDGVALDASLVCGPDGICGPLPRADDVAGDRALEADETDSANDAPEAAR